MPRSRVSRFVLVKSLGVLPMHYKVCELAETLCVPERTLRDGLVTGVPHFRDQRNNLWILEGFRRLGRSSAQTNKATKITRRRGRLRAL